MSTDTKSVERLQSHIEWLEGDHENCNPFLADDIRALAAERDAATARVAELEALNAAMLAVLQWYGENARLARLIHSEGDEGRALLAADGGKKAFAFLVKKESRDG